MDKHCTREEILEGAHRGQLTRPASREHTSRCDECRRLWDLAVFFVGAATEPLLEAPSSWVEKAVALARTEGSFTRTAKALAGLVFDSWAAPATAGLRGKTAYDTRRLSWDAGDWTVDLRAEAVPGGWEFVAQVRSGEAPCAGARVESGRTRVHTDRSGMATWSASRPPRKLTVQTPESRFELELVSWKQPKQ